MPIQQFVMSSSGRFVAIYYAFTIALGAFVLLFHGRLAFAVDLVAAAFYVLITILFYDFSKRVTHRDRSVKRG